MKSIGHHKIAMKNKIRANRVIVAVLGMHRSGTSAIAHALSLLGVDLGSKLHPPGFDNPKGFWEDSEVVAINEDLLKAINSSYDQLDLAWDGVFGDQDAINDLRIRATSLLSERLATHTIWGFKDPRTCRLIRFWKPIIESSGAECRVVLALRNPLSSAISLQKRNGLPIEKGCFLWLQHVLPSVLDPLGKKTVAVDYDLLMQSPFEQLTRIAKGLGFGLASEDDAQVAEYVQDFLDDGLRHTHFLAEQTALDSRVPSDVLAAYEIILGAARDEVLLDSRRVRNPLEAIQSRLAAYSQSFGYAKTLEDERHKLYLVVNERDRQLILLNQEIGARDETVVRLKETESALNEKIQVLEQALDDRAAGESEARRALHESEARIQHLNVAMADIQEVAKERAAAELEARRALHESETRLQQLNVAMAEIQKVIGERTAAELAAKCALLESEVRLQRLNSVLNGKQREIECLEHQNEQSTIARVRLKDAVGKLESHEALLQAALRSSNQETLAKAQVVADRDHHIARLYACISERDARVADLNRALNRKADLIQDMKGAEVLGKARIHGLENALEESNQNLLGTRAQRDDVIRQNETLNHAVNTAQLESKALRQGVADREREIAQILNSLSWRITKPLRFLGRISLTQPAQRARKWLSDTGHKIWWNLPIESSRKQRLKGSIFSTFPFFFSWSQAYRSWKSLAAPWKVPVQIGPEHSFQLREVPQKTGPDYVPIYEGLPPKYKPARLICFYLPQFHPIPENDEWWGEGFTEWTNVRPALPQFEGHYQPRIPGELGYYNLLDRGVQARQVELAKLYGIEGFCFYFYWFGGKRLLEAPILNYRATENLDLPFCLCWANENWSRRWDGLDSEILIAQNHSKDDDIAFIAHVSEYMRDRRYIRVGGKPLLMVYRPSLLPDPIATVTRWRDWCRENRIGEIFLAYTQSFETVSPVDYGFDAAIEFPPNNSSPPNITETVVPLQEDFGVTVYDWKVFVERSERYTNHGYKVFRSVCPSWDNTARRRNFSTVFKNTEPVLYQRWLENAIDDTMARHQYPSERLIFVNAWNEWAEGAHLEPDARYGYAYLQATRNALETVAAKTPKNGRLVLVSHDAHPHGAQLLTLNLARTLSQEFGIGVELVCLGDGPLKTEFAKWATVHDLAGADPRDPQAIALAEGLRGAGIQAALVNTTVSGFFLETLSRAGFRCVSLIHELSGVLEQMNLVPQAKAIAEFADRIVFPADEVASSFRSKADYKAAKRIIRPQGLYKRRSIDADREAHRHELRAMVGLPRSAKIILGVGYADHRKGIDLFVAAGLKLQQAQPDAHWVWIGHWDNAMQASVQRTLSEYPETAGHFHFPGLQTDTDLFYDGADVFALTSREDPFPSVALEAMDAGLPVVAFDGSGGIVPLLKAGCGYAVPMEDAGAFADAVGHLLATPRAREEIGQNGKKAIRDGYSFRHYIFDLLDYLEIGLKRISVIVPNYNYERYQPERLQTILDQTYPLYEIIYLDDCSSDNSVAVAENILKRQPVDWRLIRNEQNSGSVFRQWQKGVELAKGDYVWLAEADDNCEPEFLEELVKPFEDTEVVLSYCESKQLDEQGNILATNYLDYVADISLVRWTRPYVVEGIEEIRTALSVKNTIPNVSGVLLKRCQLIEVLVENIDDICSFRIAGDWFVYVRLLRNGKLAFTNQPLNGHRRHERGVTIGGAAAGHLNEIVRMQHIVSSNFPIAPAERQLAAEYASKLKAQFKLN